MNFDATTHILTLSCPDTMGIVAAVSGFLLQNDCNILEAAQFDDSLTGRFFMRTVFSMGTQSPPPTMLTTAFEGVGRRFAMEWAIHNATQRPKVLLLVSKFGHCLNDLLYQHSIDAIPMDVVGVVSNHLVLQPLANMYAIPFHHLPVSKDTKSAQEDALRALVEETKTELVVLARYMQILSPSLCHALSGSAINIHHSFLPSFKGAKPYHQAHERGVKVIGATAHFVTDSLDEGPIIEQDTVRVTHAQTPDQLVALGRNIENQVLARAIIYYCERRVLLNGVKTVVFQ